MSLEQVTTFYDVLTQNQRLYQEYFNQCSCQGFFEYRHWDKTKIVNFANNLGYSFTESELEQAWFDTNTSTAKESIKPLEEKPVAAVKPERKKAKAFALLSFL